MSRHKVNIWPEGKSFEIDENETLLAALQREGFYIKSSCGGVATCGDCVVKIKGGEDHVTPPTFAELKILGNVFHITKERLSCQTRITGEVSIDISKHTDAGPGSTPKPYVMTRLRKRDPEKEAKEAQAVALAQEQKMQEAANRDGAPDAPKWYRHWEKNKDQEGNTGPKKHRGGNRRPKAFKFPQEKKGDEDEDN